MIGIGGSWASIKDSGGSPQQTPPPLSAVAVDGAYIPNADQFNQNDVPASTNPHILAGSWDACITYYRTAVDPSIFDAMVWVDGLLPNDCFAKKYMFHPTRTLIWGGNLLYTQPNTSFDDSTVATVTNISIASCAYLCRNNADCSVALFDGSGSGSCQVKSFTVPSHADTYFTLPFWRWKNGVYNVTFNNTNTDDNITPDTENRIISPVALALIVSVSTVFFISLLLSAVLIWRRAHQKRKASNFVQYQDKPATGNSKHVLGTSDYLQTVLSQDSTASHCDPNQKSELANAALVDQNTSPDDSCNINNHNITPPLPIVAAREYDATDYYGGFRTPPHSPILALRHQHINPNDSYNNDMKKHKGEDEIHATIPEVSPATTNRNSTVSPLRTLSVPQLNVKHPQPATLARQGNLNTKPLTNGRIFSVPNQNTTQDILDRKGTETSQRSLSSSRMLSLSHHTVQDTLQRNNTVTSKTSSNRRVMSGMSAAGLPPLLYLNEPLKRKGTVTSQVSGSSSTFSASSSISSTSQSIVLIGDGALFASLGVSGATDSIERGRRRRLERTETGKRWASEMLGVDASVSTELHADDYSANYDDDADTCTLRRGATVASKADSLRSFKPPLVVGDGSLFNCFQ